MNSKRFLTLFWYDDIGEQHLYKDVGGIPYALAKYRGWSSIFAYGNINGSIKNDEYEKYVNLLPINLAGKSKYGRRWEIIKFLWNKAAELDVLNMYHYSKYSLVYCWIAKMRNPSIKTYIKLDLDTKGFRNISKTRWWNILGKYIDVFTVETKRYIGELNSLKKFKNKVSYLPNGFFTDLVEKQDRKIDKENIILTVGRLGTYQKNTELLVDAFANIDIEQIKDWKLYLVGSYTDDFFKYVQETIDKYPPVKDKIVLTGNISDKQRLYEFYQKAKIFALTSRTEGFPLVIPEAIQNGCYVITTNSFPAVKEIINSEIGIITGNSEEDLVEAFCKAITKYKNNEINNMSIRNIANKTLSWEVLAKRIDEYLRL